MAKPKKLKLSDLNPAVATMLTLQAKTTAAEKRAKTLTIKKITELLDNLSQREVDAVYKIVATM